MRWVVLRLLAEGMAASPPLCLPLLFPSRFFWLGCSVPMRSLEIFGVWDGGFIPPLRFIASTGLWLAANAWLVGGSAGDELPWDAALQGLGCVVG